MRLLVLEGNDRETWQARQAAGGVPYHQRFVGLLGQLMPEAEVSVAFPADGGEHLPGLAALKARYQGVMITGSALSVYQQIPAVQRQLDYAETLFQSGLPIWGSCWGLQVAATVAGGQVAACGAGREFPVAEAIQVSEAGRASPWLSRTDYSAWCIHLDEVVRLPEGAEVLAHNAHSQVQALAFRHRASHFFGVQYHPEFCYQDVRFLHGYLRDSLLAEGCYADASVYRQAVDDMALAALSDDLGNHQHHAQELKNWLQWVKCRRTSTIHR